MGAEIDRRLGQGIGYVDAERGQETHRIARPADRNGRGGEQVFEHQAPADEPGQGFAKGGIGVAVGAAGGRNHRGEFGITQASHGAGEAGQHEAEHDRRAGVVGGSGSGDHEDTSADDRAQSEKHQMMGRQRTLETDLAVQTAFDRLAGIDMRLCRDRLADHQALVRIEQTIEHIPLPCWSRYRDRRRRWSCSDTTVRPDGAACSARRLKVARQGARYKCVSGNRAIARSGGIAADWLRMVGPPLRAGLRSAPTASDIRPVLG